MKLTKALSLFLGGTTDADQDEISDDEVPDVSFSAVITDPAEVILPRGRGVEPPSPPVQSSSSSSKTTSDRTLRCNCHLNKGQPCCTNFSDAEIESTRLQFLNLSQEKDEFDIAILSKLECGIHMEETTRKSKKGNVKRSKVRLDYFHKGHSICRTFFLYIHCMGKDKLDALIAHYKLNGIETRTHKNTKKLPKKSLKYEDTRRVLDFILNYAEINGIQLPGRTPRHWNTDVKLLPTNVNKKTVYEEYRVSCENAGFRCVKIRTFRKLWQQLCPFVRTMLPATDLCWTCQSATYRISQSANRSDNEKQKIIQDVQEHHKLVVQEREYYKTALEDTKEHFLTQQKKNEPPTTNHISFDFAQQVHFPFDPLQPGPIFFKTPRKCGLFGINSEPVGTQVNYIIDEAHSCGKGGNTVISYIHHYLEFHDLKTRNLHFHADNCSGQNKNNFVIWYFLWRTLTGLNDKITLSFLIAGHTKFSPDGGFGLIKKLFRKTKIDCLDDIASVVNQSSKMNVGQLVGYENAPSLVPVCNWDVFLCQFFKKVKKIKSYQHFHFDTTGLKVQVHSQSDLLSQKILRKDPDGSYPDTVTPEGLSLQRQWYLFKDIRQFVADEKKDIVAPKPAATIPEPEAESSSSNDEPAPPPKKAKAAPRGRGRGRGETQ